VTMTHEEILAQSKVGGFMTIRIEIDSVGPLGGVWSRRYGWLHQPDIIAIEPPLETDAENIARLEARIAELESQLACPPTEWIAWNSGENPVPGKFVRYRMRDGDESNWVAKYLRWTHEGGPSDIVAYRVID
jgi:hypothetical protein